MLYGTPVLTKLPMVTSSQRIYSLRLGIGFTSQISRRTNRLTFHWTTRRTLHSTLTPLVDVRVTLPLSVFSGNTDWQNNNARVTEAMDVFSAGCVIAELFREGAPLFTLSQLFKYREGELNPDGLLTSIEDVGVRVRIPPDDKVIRGLI